MHGVTMKFVNSCYCKTYNQFS